MARTGARAQPRRRAPQARGLATRERLLQAAEHLFTRFGYDGTSMSDIAGRARVSVGTLYHHFADKHSMLLELIDQWGDRVSGERRRVLPLEEMFTRSPRDAIGGFLRRAYDRLRKEPSLYLVVLGLADRDEDVRSRYRRIEEVAVERWTALIELGRRRGVIRADVDPPPAAFLIHHAIDMAATQILVRGRAHPEPERVLEELTHMICRYILEEQQ